MDIENGLSESLVWLLFDAQTSGGLLASLPADQAEKAVGKLRANGVHAAAVIGSITETKWIKIVK